MMDYNPVTFLHLIRCDGNDTHSKLSCGKTIYSNLYHVGDRMEWILTSLKTSEPLDLYHIPSHGVQASAGEAALAMDKISRELEAARQALKDQFRQMQESEDAAMAAQQQASLTLTFCLRFATHTELEVVSGRGLDLPFACRLNKEMSAAQQQGILQTDFIGLASPFSGPRL